jgi:toll-interacting protein
VKSISVEVYDECALTMDELIAYGQIPIPEIVFRGESADQWLQLSGKQGENKEGSIHMIFTLLVKISFCLPFSCFCGCDA